MRQFATLYEQKFSLLSITFPQGFKKPKKFGHCPLGSWGQNTFKQSEEMNNKKTIFLCGNFTPFMSKKFHFFPLLFPKDSQNPKSFDIGFLEVGKKDCLTE